MNRSDYVTVYLRENTHTLSRINKSTKKPIISFSAPNAEDILAVAKNDTKINVSFKSGRTNISLFTQIDEIFVHKQKAIILIVTTNKRLIEWNPVLQKGTIQ